MMTDPIADMLTRIRNAITARHTEVRIPASKIKHQIAGILKSEGYLEGVEVIDEGVQGTLELQLRYHAETGECPIHGLKRLSRPGRRFYACSADIPEILNGLGVAIVSTSKGLMTGKAAKKANLGGEVICEVW